MFSADFINGLINSVIAVADKFINKVDTGRARSKETYKELTELKVQALELREELDKEDIEEDKEK